MHSRAGRGQTDPRHPTSLKSRLKHTAVLREREKQVSFVNA